MDVRYYRAVKTQPMEYVYVACFPRDNVAQYRALWQSFSYLFYYPYVVA